MNKLSIKNISKISISIHNRMVNEEIITDSKKDNIINIIKSELIGILVETHPHLINLEEDKIIKIYNNVLH